MPLSAREVCSSLQKKGFKSANKDHKVYVYYKQDGTVTHIRTKVSHGSGFDIGEPLVRKMAEQCRLSKSEFKEYIDCRISQAGYERIVFPS